MSSPRGESSAVYHLTNWIIINWKRCTIKLHKGKWQHSPAVERGSKSHAESQQNRSKASFINWACFPKSQNWTFLTSSDSSFQPTVPVLLRFQLFLTERWPRLSNRLNWLCQMQNSTNPPKEKQQLKRSGQKSESPHRQHENCGNFSF